MWNSLLSATFVLPIWEVQPCLCHLSSKAKLWGTASWHRDSWFCYIFKEFATELNRVFDPVLPERESSHKLFSIKQGKRKVTDYIINFHTIAADRQWNESALTDAFFYGLDDQIKDELPDDLRSLEELATRIDLRMAEQSHERRGKAENPPHWRDRNILPTTPVTHETVQPVEPMQPWMHSSISGGTKTQGSR